MAPPAVDPPAEPVLPLAVVLEPPDPPDVPPEEVPPEVPPDDVPEPDPPLELDPPPPLPVDVCWGLLTDEKVADPLYPEAVTSFGTTVTEYVPLGSEMETASDVEEPDAELPALDTYRSKLSLELPQWMDTVAWPS
jgi:hypothetical protein